MTGGRRVFSLGAGVSLQVDIHDGGSRPIVLLHGFTGDASTMDLLAAPLAQERTVIVPNLIGHGGSTGPVDAYSVEVMAAQIVELLDLLRAEALIAPAAPVDMVGYSMGGRVALCLACTHPEQLRSLSLIGASAGIADDEERAERARADDDLATSIERDGLETFVDRWMANPLFATQERLGVAALAEFRAQRLRNDAGELARSLRGASTGRMRPLHRDLPTCGVPIRLIAGADDAKFCAIADQMAKALPYAGVSVIEGAGHAAHLEQPGAVVAAITDHADGARTHNVHLALPLVDSLTTANGSITRRESVLVRVASDRQVGWGEAAPMPGWSQHSIEECLAAIESGLSTTSPRSARSAVTGAALDLAARDAEAPLFAHLAELAGLPIPTDPTIEVHGLVGATDPQTVAAEAAALVRLGYATIKLKVGAVGLDDDLARVDALRAAAPDASLRLDANGGWDRAAARDALHALAPYRIEFCEEPIAGILDMVDLAAEVPIPIVADESVRTAEDLELVMKRGAVLHGLVIKPQAIGGPTLAIDAILMARRAGLQVIVTSMIDSAVGLAHAAHVAAATSLSGAHGLGTARLLARDVAAVHDALPIVDGVMRFAAVADPERWGRGLGLGLVSPAPVAAP